MAVGLSTMSTVSRLAIAVAIGILISASNGCKMAADGQNLQGVQLYQQGQYQAALQEFQKVLSTDPKNSDAYYNMAATMHRMGAQKGDKAMLTQAETLYNQCLDLDPNNADCYRGLAVLLVESGRQDQAFTLLKNWAAGNATSADARIELARLYEEFSDDETAKVYLNQAIMADQNSARAWAALGRIREKSGDPQQALANYQRAYNLNSSQAAVAERIATLSRSLATTQDPNRPDATRTVTSPTPPMR